jgi:hypothetical protein
MPNVRSGANGVQLNEIQARAILQQLAAGQANALNALDPIPGGAPDPLVAFMAQVVNGAPLGAPVNADWESQGREYGIIVEHGTNEAHIVVGTNGAVQWAGLLPHGRAVAHVHPLVDALPQRPGRLGAVLPAAWSRRWVQGAGHNFADIIRTPGLYVQFLPTIGDITFCATHQIADHTVYTPYAFHNNQLVDPHTQPQAPLVRYRILNAARSQNGDYVATLEAHADGQQLWSHTATVRAQNAYMDRQTIYSLT